MKIELDSGLLKSLLVFGSVIEARDAYTGGHTWRVAHYSRRLAEKIGLSDTGVFMASLGGFVHDIGKVGVSDLILNKPASLDEPEYGLIRLHPVTGRSILIDHPLAALVLDAVHHHHERIDGAGYPDQLSGDQLSIHPKIISIADAFDAMTSTRPYRAALGPAEAIARLRAGRGSQWDPGFVDSFTALISNGELDAIIGHSDEGRPLLNCPVCGPIIAVPRNKKDGDTIYCNSCKGKFQLHVKEDSFEAEFKNVILPAVQPEIDFELLDELARRAPKQIDEPPK